MNTSTKYEVNPLNGLYGIMQKPKACRTPGWTRPFLCSLRPLLAGTMKTFHEHQNTNIMAVDPWLLALPVHQQPCHWLCRINKSFHPTKNVLKLEHSETIIRSIPWLLMSWRHKLPGHQQPCYWLDDRSICLPVWQDASFSCCSNSSTWIASWQLSHFT